MTKGFIKNIRRSITGSLGLYIAIMLIVMLGCAFYTGLKLAHPVMLAIQKEYIQSTGFYDLRLVSTIGFDDDDIAEILKSDGVEIAVGSVYSDFIWQRGDDELVYHALALTEGINEPELVAGRLPEAANEWLADSYVITEDDIGTVIEITACNSDETIENFTYTEYTIVGIARSPLYMDVSRGTTALGNGSITGFIIIPIDGFSFEYYTEVYVLHSGTYAPYSDAYNDMIDAFSDSIEGDATAAIQIRFDRIVSDAQTEIADAEQELEDGKADGQAELDDAWQQLEDAAVELDDAKKQLEDAALELADAETQLADAASALADAKKQLDDAKLQLDVAAAQLAEAESELIAAKEQLEAADAQLNEAKEQLDAAAVQLDSAANALSENWSTWEDALLSGRDDVAAGQSQIDEARSDLEAARSELEAQEETYNTLLALADENDTATQMQLAAMRAALDEAWAEVIGGETILETQQSALDSANTSLDSFETAIASYYAALNEYNSAVAETEAGWADYNTGLVEYELGLAEYNSGVEEYESGLAEYETGLKDYQNGIVTYQEGLAEYEEGLAEYEDGLAEYEDGLSEYYDGLAEFESDISEAEAEIADARAELEDLDDPELYVLTRSSNSGYVTFESNSLIVEKLSSVFPIFFFLIAALVCSTTMTRMVDDDRTLIGCLRSLGYSRGAILTKYVLYAGSAATIGCVVGYFLGGYIFPLVIWIAYQMLYNIDGFIIVYNAWLLLACLAASLLCSAGRTYLACRLTMKSAPADLIRPKTPSAGKRIFLERITPVWKRLKFLHKVTLRNIFRFKKRMIMMVLGIAGCTALVLTGFGIKDSVANTGDYQYDDIMKYHIMVSSSDAIDEEIAETYRDICADNLDASMPALEYSGDLTGNEATKSVYLIASDDDAFADLIDLHADGEAVALPQTGEILITDKLAVLVGVSIGDTVTVTTSDDKTGEAIVAGFVENYVQHYIYMTCETYSFIFETNYAPSCMFIRLKDNTDEYSTAATIFNEDGVSSVSVVTDTRNTVENMMKSLNYVVALVLASAGALAFIVMFNLGNINISEREREIATIKVLGFHSRETSAYVFRENFILSLMGICFGLPIGVLFHTFVLSQINVDMISFKVIIHPISYAYTVALVILFTVLTDLILRRKINRIDMAQSLKSVE